MNTHDQPLLIVLVAVQFLVHALGWTMAARLFRGWRAAEGQFAGFWLALALGLSLYVPAWPSGHLLRNLGDLLVIGAAALQHRGLALYWAQRPADRAYAALVALAFAVIAFSLALPNGHAWRVAAVCLGAGVPLLATAALTWRHGRQVTPALAPMLAGTLALLAAVLLVRAVQALFSDGQTKMSIDGPGRFNVALVILVMFVGGCLNLAHIRLVLGRVLQRLTAQAQTDPLTGAVNRRGLLQGAAQVHGRAVRGSHAYSVLMVDIDHFKAVNDQHGHAGGDRVLQRVARNLRDGLRSGDLVARWGGEEFCVLLPRIGADDAQALAQRMVQQIADGGDPQVTVSIGVAEWQAGDDTPESVIRRADAALYRAKESGRNRVNALSQPAPS